MTDNTTEKKQLWVLVGGNGAGKSTLYLSHLQSSGLPFINADIIAKEVYPNDPERHSYDAAILAKHKRERLLVEGRSFCFETVFSHPSKIDFLAKAKSYGFEVNMVFIHLNDDQLNRARVSQRVIKGGHDVPDKKVIERIPRVIDNVKTAVALCDSVLIFDNSSSENPYELVASVRNGKRHIIREADWVLELFC